MFFILSKIAFALIAPSNFCLLLIGCGLALGRWQQLGRRMSIVGFGLLLIFGFSPVGKWLTKPLEDRFAGSGLPAQKDVTHIILLGGFELAELGKWRGQLSVNSSAERLLAIPLLARRYPKAKIVFTGGYGWLLGKRLNAVKPVTDYLVEAGLARGRLMLEGRSRNTWQNAVFVKELLDAEKTACPCGFFLVTSAWHMPRSMGIFRQAGFEGADRRLYAWPVDFRTLGGADLWLPFGWLRDGLRLTDLAAKEWLGLVAYWITGRSSALWPGPRKGAG